MRYRVESTWRTHNWPVVDMHQPYYNMNRPYLELIPRLILLAWTVIAELAASSS
jgi:hypothetical protein